VGYTVIGFGVFLAMLTGCVRSCEVCKERSEKNNGYYVHGSIECLGIGYSIRAFDDNGTARTRCGLAICDSLIVCKF
jgi:hypothetical protein